MVDCLAEAPVPQKIGTGRHPALQPQISLMLLPLGLNVPAQIYNQWLARIAFPQGGEGVIVGMD